VNKYPDFIWERERSKRIFDAHLDKIEQIRQYYEVMEIKGMYLK